MALAKIVATLGKMRQLPERLVKSGLALAALVLCELGARVGLPDLNGEVLSDFILRNGSGGLLGLYDLFVGGAVSRGAVLALGIMPYVSARIFVRLARIVSPQLDALTTTAPGRAQLSRWTRVLTTGFAVVQSYGFARFVQTVPGAVANPGPGFVIRTMLTLTAGALVVMWMGEKLSAPSTDLVDDAPVQTPDEEVLEDRALPSASAPLLQAGPFVVPDMHRARQHAMDANRPTRSE